MRRLLIFVKEPVPRQVKTRLATEIGAEAACHVYRRCVERTLERLVALRGEITLCVEPAEAMGRLQAWLGSAWPVQPQRGATLGERLADATDSAFAAGMRRVIVIGTDSPWLDHLRIEEAFSAMERTDLVLGPTEDGGYYLVGLAKSAPGLFHGISWSTSQVLDQTLAAARASGMTSALLPEGYDIDRLTELQRWMKEDPACGLTPASSLLYNRGAFSVEERRLFHDAPRAQP
ncbi:MAG: TIGR04282 family arsenosugar biosynthesis glycosyltransferase [Candidatus Omnitrophota bacterium]|nr:TIGR04282 family arsenosugar biosynthesis glycosyltransferase [Candidatus Omnitrophota bacterium]